jgi:hypothetical protein
MLAVLCRLSGITASSNTKEPTQDSQHLLRSPISEGEAVIPKSLHRTANIY